MKILLYAVAAAELVFLFLTKSRNALLAVGLFTIVAIGFLLRRRRIAFRNGVLGLVAVFPILFAIAYLFFIDNADSVKLLSFFAGEGKLLNSRSKVWKVAFQAFESSPVFGAYYQISGGTGLSQMHNTHVDILTSYGLSVLVLVCVYLYLLMRDSQMKVKPSASSTPLLGFICALFPRSRRGGIVFRRIECISFSSEFFLAMTDKGEETDEERRTEAPPCA
ncbi:MAG: O-antigen ligase family protein [Oscillospiraceae bacterium]|nr:MAG: O-antigen ligase family protein [Oscillospiraceae bacterium]